MHEFPKIIIEPKTLSQFPPAFCHQRCKIHFTILQALTPTIHGLPHLNKLGYFTVTDEPMYVRIFTIIFNLLFLQTPNNRASVKNVSFQNEAPSEQVKTQRKRHFELCNRSTTFWKIRIFLNYWSLQNVHEKSKSDRMHKKRKILIKIGKKKKEGIRDETGL